MGRSLTCTNYVRAVRGSLGFSVCNNPSQKRGYQIAALLASYTIRDAEVVEFLHDVQHEIAKRAGLVSPQNLTANAIRHRKQ
jgi:hypothetical protein